MGLHLPKDLGLILEAAAEELGKLAEYELYRYLYFIMSA